MIICFIYFCQLHKLHVCPVLGVISSKLTCYCNHILFLYYNNLYYFSYDHVVTCVTKALYLRYLKKDKEKKI